LTKSDFDSVLAAATRQRFPAKVVVTRQGDSADRLFLLHRDQVPGGIALHLTNKELANTANVTVFTTSRLMSEWQRPGALVKSCGKILLCSSERLFEHEVN
jgi:hypothetical protein